LARVHSFTRDYTAFCDSAFGFYLHHTPTEAMKEKAAIPESIELSWRLACEQEGIDPLRPDRLPLIFSLDATLKISIGDRYDAAEMGANVGKTSPTAARMRMEAATLQGQSTGTGSAQSTVATVMVALLVVIAEMAAAAVLTVQAVAVVVLVVVGAAVAAVNEL
jgi:hypothetical protein